MPAGWEKLVRLDDWRDRCVFTVVYCVFVQAAHRRRRQKRLRGGRRWEARTKSDGTQEEICVGRQTQVTVRLRLAQITNAMFVRRARGWSLMSVCVCAGLCCVIWCGWSWAVTSWRPRVHSQPRITSRSSWRPRSNRFGPKDGCRPGEFRYQRVVNNIDSLHILTDSSLSLSFLRMLFKESRMAHNHLTGNTWVSPLWRKWLFLNAN